MNQRLEYIFLRNNLTLKNLPFLHAMQYSRAQENITAGLELGLSAEESVKMALEDFANPAERTAEQELKLNFAWLLTQDQRDVYQAMLVCDIYPRD